MSCSGPPHGVREPDLALRGGTSGGPRCGGGPRCDGGREPDLALRGRTSGPPDLALRGRTSGPPGKSGARHWGGRESDLALIGRRSGPPGKSGTRHCGGRESDLALRGRKSGPLPPLHGGREPDRALEGLAKSTSGTPGGRCREPDRALAGPISGRDAGILSPSKRHGGLSALNGVIGGTPALFWSAGMPDCLSPLPFPLPRFIVLPQRLISPLSHSPYVADAPSAEM